MTTVSVRYITDDDVDAAVAFYVERLGFNVEMRPAQSRPPNPSRAHRYSRSSNVESALRLDDGGLASSPTRAEKRSGRQAGDEVLELRP